MVHLFKKKLSNNNGESMIIALVLFLICAMVSSIIIAAAASGSSRNINRTTQQRAYLAVSSAATMIAEQIEVLGAYEETRVETIYGCNQYASEDNYTKESPYEDGTLGYRINNFWIDNTLDAILVDTVPCQVNKVESTIDGTSATGILQGVVMTATEEIFDGSTSYEESFTVALTEADERLPEVIGSFHMDASYNITIVLTTAESNYSVTVSVKGSIEQGTESYATQSQGCLHDIYYKKLLKNEAYETVKEELWITATVVTSTHTITWGTPVLEKGGTIDVE